MMEKEYFRDNRDKRDKCDDRDKKGLLKKKSYAFAIRIVKMTWYLQEDKNERVLSKQVLRSGTSIGALVREAEFAQSTADFVHKLNVALKEANETDYWLNLLKDTGYISEDAFESIHSDCKELIAMFVSSIKTLKMKISNPNNF